jgi:hypothetical protein
MAEKFDPYYKWLGIPPKDQPPSHYRLLGLEIFESDPEVIDRAANRLMDYLHSITDGEHLAHSQALLNEIAAARLCLLDHEQKALYDERLRAAEAAKKPDRGDIAERADIADRDSIFDEPDSDDSGERSGERSPEPSGERSVRAVRGKRPRRAAPPAAPPPVVLPPAPPPVQRHGGGGDHRARAKKSAAPMLMGLAACLVVAGGAAVYWFMLKPQKIGAPSKSDAVASSRGQKEAKTPDGSSPALDGPHTPDAGKTSDSAKTDDPPLTVDPTKTSDPPAFPTPKEGPPSKPRPETAALFDAAKEAVKKKDVKEALELLEKYLRDPGAPEIDKAAKWLVFLRDISSDETMLQQMSQVSNADLLQIEQGKLILKNTVAGELNEVFMDAIRRNIPEAKRQRGMMADAPKPKEKAPPDAKTATGNPTTPEPMPPVPDPLTKPAEFLASQGLTKRGTQWQLNEDAAIAAMSGLAELERKYTLAAKKTADGLKSLNRRRAEYSKALQQEDLAKTQNRQPPPQVAQFLAEWRPKIGNKLALGSNLDLHTLLQGRMNPRTDFLLAVLKAHKALDPVEEKYAALAADSRVAEALGKLPGEKVGPSTRFSQAAAKFAKTAALVLADETPLYLKAEETLLSVLINDVPIDVAFMPGQNFNVITEELVKKLGIAVPPDAPRGGIKRTGKDGTKQPDVEGRVIKIASVRLSKHVLKDLEFIVTGPDGAYMGTGLEPRAFNGFRFEPDYDNFVFKIRPQDAPDPKPEKKAAR